MTGTSLRHWLDLWASSLHDWHSYHFDGATSYYRRQGIVENLFDVDGTDFEGRADLNLRLTTELRTSLDSSDLKEHITRCWSLLRHRHILLSARSLQGQEFLPQSGGLCWLDKYFVYHVPSSREDIADQARDTITFLDEAHDSDDIDIDEFWIHALNCSRMVDEKQHLARFLIFPFEYTDAGIIRLKIHLVAGHQIADGLTLYRWATDFISLLNYPERDLEREAGVLCSPATTTQRLPRPQEALYPPLPTNIARLRWQWLITRVLRHVKIPVPASFQNPLRRDSPLEYGVEFPRRYPKLLNYLPKPPLNSYTVGLEISERSTHNLIKLCRQAGISRGSGSFVLVALVMMRLEEKYRPGIALTDRLPFVGSFPVNPRPFLSGIPTSGKEDSVMLAFSDGVTLPFIPSSCDLLTSFRVLGRLAHRQLNQFQKKKRTAEATGLLSSRSPSQLLPALYLSTIERLEDRLPPHRRAGLNPQGAYPATQGGSLATCGISSIGDVSGLISRGVYDVDKPSENPVVADFRDMKSAVRAREGEFLVGSAGSKHHQGFFVSYDGSALDPEKVADWREMLLNILDFDMDASVMKKTDTTSRMIPASKL